MTTKRNTNNTTTKKKKTTRTKKPVNWQDYIIVFDTKNDWHDPLVFKNETELKKAIISGELYVEDSIKFFSFGDELNMVVSVERVPVFEEKQKVVRVG